MGFVHGVSLVLGVSSFFLIMTVYHGGGVGIGWAMGSCIWCGVNGGE